MLFVVYHWNHTLVYLYIFTQEYLFLEEIIEEFQFFHCRFIPSVHGRVAYGYAGFTVLLYQAVERQKIHELADNNVCQYGRACHAFAYGAGGSGLIRICLSSGCLSLSSDFLITLWRMVFTI